MRVIFLPAVPYPETKPRHRSAAIKCRAMPSEPERLLDCVRGVEALVCA